MEPYESLLTGNQNLLVSAIVFQQMAEFEYYSACVNSSEAHSRLGIFEPIIGIFFENEIVRSRRKGWVSVATQNAWGNVYSRL